MRARYGPPFLSPWSKHYFCNCLRYILLLCWWRRKLKELSLGLCSYNDPFSIYQKTHENILQAAKCVHRFFSVGLGKENACQSFPWIMRRTCASNLPPYAPTLVDNYDCILFPLLSMSAQTVHLTTLVRSENLPFSKTWVSFEEGVRNRFYKYIYYSLQSLPLKWFPWDDSASTSIMGLGLRISLGLAIEWEIMVFHCGY